MTRTKKTKQITSLTKRWNDWDLVAVRNKAIEETNSKWQQAVQKLKEEFCINRNEAGERAYPDNKKSVCCGYCNFIDIVFEGLI